MERTTVPAGSAVPLGSVPAGTAPAKAPSGRPVPPRTASSMAGSGGSGPARTSPGGRRRHPDEMRPSMMTDAEIKAELETATSDRHAALLAEREERRAYRASMFPPRRASS
jgi:hypothetical protein